MADKRVGWKEGGDSVWRRDVHMGICLCRTNKHQHDLFGGNNGMDRRKTQKYLASPRQCVSVRVVEIHYVLVVNGGIGSFILVRGWYLSCYFVFDIGQADAARTSINELKLPPKYFEKYEVNKYRGNTVASSLRDCK